MKFVHTNIISEDWKKLVDFYIQVFECKIVPPVRNQSGAWLERGTAVKNAALQGAHLLLPGYGEHGPTLEIFQYNHIIRREADMPNHKGFGHIAFEVENVAAVVEKMEQHGGSKLGEITERYIEGAGTIRVHLRQRPRRQYH
jgi:predicted enzyme related to lactoylglutathione lyase